MGINFDLPTLPYNYEDLEPIIDKETMMIHHTKHHQGYINKLKAALTNYPALLDKDLTELLQHFDTVPDEIKTAVRNNGGGHHNHTLFWEALSPQKTAPTQALLDAITKTFGSLDACLEEIQKKGMSLFGSGWVWLVLNQQEELHIVQTHNQDSPLLFRQIPLLGIDVWEHAYYLHYQNKRAEYLKNILTLLNWQVISQRYEKVIVT